MLVFDEMKTGFRLRPGGYQEYGKFEPDLAAFGKAMANGYPIAAVVGRAAVMEAAANTWISSTLAGEATALAAIAGVLEWHDRTDVCDTLWRTGEEMIGAMRRAIAASGVDGVDGRGHRSNVVPASSTRRSASRDSSSSRSSRMFCSSAARTTIAVDRAR